MSLFLSFCFSFQTRTDLVLVTFYCNAAVRCFLKTFIKLPRKRLWWKPFLGKFLVTENGIRYWRLSISFPNTFLLLLPNIEQKRIPLNDNIVWCKRSRVIKDLSKSGSFFLLNASKYLDARLFYSFYAETLCIFWNVFLSRKIRET